MSTFRPYRAGILFNATNYKHCVPNGTGNCFLLPASCLLSPVSCLLFHIHNFKLN
jgi:hypothetical protein